MIRQNKINNCNNYLIRKEADLRFGTIEYNFKNNDVERDIAKQVMLNFTTKSLILTLISGKDRARFMTQMSIKF